jgi:hypothetical protein
MSSRQEIFQAASARALSFSRLSLGWHYGTGAKIDLSIVSRSIELIELGFLLNYTKVSVFPNEDGDVFIAFAKGDYRVEARLQTDSKASLVLESEGNEIYDLCGIADERLHAELGELARGLCSISALPIRRNLTSTYNVSHQVRLPLRREGGVPPLSTGLVWKQNQDQFANTYYSSTKREYRVTQQCFSSSKALNCRQAVA